MNKSIGERIKKLRKSRHITQTQIYELTGISSGNLSGIESGKSLPSASAVIELARVLQCSTDYILIGTDPPKSSILESKSLNPNDTGKRILKLCEANKINEETLAEILNIPVSDILFAETGIIDASSTIKKIAIYFGVDEDYLKNGPASFKSNDLSESMFIQLYKLLSNESKDKIMSYLIFLSRDEDL